MQKTVSGIKKWLSVRVAEVLDRNDMDVWRLCVSSLRNHKDAGHRVSRSDDPCFNPHEYGFPRACPERSRRVSLLTGVPSDKGPHEQVFVRGEEGQVLVAGVIVTWESTNFNHPIAGQSYFNELMSITKRYFTSCFSMRSKASLIFWIGMTSTSAVMLCRPQ